MALAFSLHWLWEMAQSSLYTGMLQRSWYDATRLCTIASVGDVAITLGAYTIVASLSKDRFWAFRSPSSQPKPRYVSVPARQLGLYLAIGLFVTAIMEFVNIAVLYRWEYGPAMPRLFGLGVAPLAQWIVVPVLIVWLARRISSRWTGGLS